MSANAGLTGGTRGLLVFAALAYTLFVLYGSLVPLDYRAIPWDEAVSRFAAIPFLDLGIGSRADWVANVLLFIPLTFLWMGVLGGGRGPLRDGLAALVLIPLAIGLSLGIEFTQLFFPQRTVSQNDIFAEALGGMLGVLAWWAGGSRFVEWLQSWQKIHSRAVLAERLAWAYLAGVLIYNVLPLDLTISLVELFHKWRDDKVNLIPFGRLPDDAAYALYEIASDAIVWTPLALLWRLDGTRSSQRVWLMTFGAALALEFMQLFVYSRVSDVTDLFTAAAGAAMGCLAGGRLAVNATPAGRPLPWLAGWPFVLAAGWMIVLMFVFWFPFEFRTDGAFVKLRLAGVIRVPFEAYYFGTEFRAVTEVLHKTLFFAPLGGLLAWGVANQPWHWRAPMFALSMLALAGLPGVVELGQLMLPEKIVDATDWLLAWFGGVAGYGVTRRLLLAPRHLPQGHHVDGHRVRDPVATAASGVRWHLPLAVGVMTIVMWGVARAPFAPYNVRELLGEGAVWMSALLLALCCYWLAVWPVWLARRRVSGWGRALQLSLGVAAYGGVAFALVNAAVPDESLHDLVGSPVLDWPGKLETGLRWAALAAVPGVLMYLATQTVRRGRGLRLGAAHFWAALPILIAAYWGVIGAAATDNLTELVARPHALAFVALCAWLYLVFVAAAWIASPVAQVFVGVRLAGAALSLPMAALFLYLGLADDIDKYGQRFSALQFLLSADRQNYASHLTVWLRYVALHGVVVASLVILQWPYFRSRASLHGKSSHADH